MMMMIEQHETNFHNLIMDIRPRYIWKHDRIKEKRSYKFDEMAQSRDSS